ncbi:glycosyltransferase [Candidatus Peregrinibacteria bacterium CG11_big_fil_rev_8_21_14_0_20_46_8]|nr:MAG: glycosyltransferase [Candidatus Peregrinibacteria bacterium CG11_big_fil_rev_8_21_14_0_20_46_8]
MRHRVLDIPFDVVTLEQARDRVLDAVRSGKTQRHVATPNPEMLLAAQDDLHFAAVLQNAWMNIPDGIGILWAASFVKKYNKKRGFKKFLYALGSLLKIPFSPKSIRTVFPERVTGTDLMQALCNASQPYNVRIFLLGAKPNVLKKTKKTLEEKFSKINIVGTYSGSPRQKDWPEIKKNIDKAKPQLLFVAYGAPQQELWINDHLKELPSVKVAIGVGGAFDYIAGKRLRAPTLLQKSGVEWLLRLLQQPSRIKRIYNAVVRFPLAIILRQYSSRS